MFKWEGQTDKVKGNFTNSFLIFFNIQVRAQIPTARILTAGETYRHSNHHSTLRFFKYELLYKLLATFEHPSSKSFMLWIMEILKFELAFAIRLTCIFWASYKNNYLRSTSILRAYYRRFMYDQRTYFEHMSENKFKTNIWALPTIHVRLTSILWTSYYNNYLRSTSILRAYYVRFMSNLHAS